MIKDFNIKIIKVFNSAITLDDKDEWSPSIPFRYNKWLRKQSKLSMLKIIRNNQKGIVSPTKVMNIILMILGVWIY